MFHQFLIHCLLWTVLKAQLQEGVPLLSGPLSTGQSESFSYTSHRSSLLFLYFNQGEADLYAIPSQGQQLISSLVGNDSLILPQGAYNIIIRATSPVNAFSLVAYTSPLDINPTPLVTQLQSAVAIGSFRYFVFSPNGISKSRYKFSLLPLVGECDLYVNNQQRGLPLIDDYDWIATGLGNDPRNVIIPAGGQFPYDLGVYAFSTCLFNLTVEASELVETNLSQGSIERTQAGNTYEYFVLNSAFPSVLIFLSLGLRSNSPGVVGEADLFASYDSFPTREAFLFSSEEVGDDSLYITDTTSVVHFSVGTFDESSSYTLYIVPFIQNNLIQLPDDQLFAVPSSIFQYFTFTSPNADKLVINLIGVQGYADIFVYDERHDFTKGYFPSRDSSSYSNTSGSADKQLVITKPRGVYNVSVSSFRAALFRLEVQFIFDDITLFPGSSYEGSLGSSFPLRFQSTIPSQSDVFIFLLTSKRINSDSSNDITLSATYDLITSNQQWQNSEQIIVRFNGPNSNTNPSQLSLMLATTYTSLDFKLTIFTCPQNKLLSSLLSPNVSYPDGVTRQTYRYYRIDLSLFQTVMRLIVSLDVSYGEVGLEIVGVEDVGVEDGVSPPHDITAELAGPDITVMYYAKVFAFTDAMYRIVYVAESDTDVLERLSPGVPYQAISPINQFLDLYVPATPTSFVDIFFTNTNSNITILVSPNSPPRLQSNDIVAVGYANDTFSLTGASGYFIAVQGVQASPFTVFVCETPTLGSAGSSANALMTALDVPNPSLIGCVSRNLYKYYNFTIPLGVSKLIITLTRWNLESDPDLFINYHATKVPAAPIETVFDWESAQVGDELWTLDSPAPGFYVLGITGYDAAVLFTLSVDLHGDNDNGASPVPLIDGVRVERELTSNAYAPFIFRTPASVAPNSKLVITLTTRTGHAELLFSSEADAQLRYSNWAVLNNTWATGLATATVQLQVSPATEYWFAVHPIIETQVSFTLVATLDGLVELVNGNAQNGFVNKDQTALYRASIFKSTGVQFTFTPLRGYGEVFISTSTPPRPDDESSYWYRSSRAGGQIITLNSTNKNFRQDSTYFVLVRGISDCSFQVLMSSNSAPVVLQQNVPQRGAVASGGAEYYSFQVLEPALDAQLVISLTKISGNIDLFADYERLPDPSSAYWQSGRDGTEDTIFIPDVVAGTYYVLVQGHAHSEYTVLVDVFSPDTECSQWNYTTDQDVQTRCDAVILTSSVPQDGLLLNPTDYTLYYFYFEQSSENRFASLRVSLTTRTGEAKLFVRQRDAPAGPFPNGFQWSSVNSSQNDVVISPACSTCVYLIAVVAESRSLFTVIATPSDGARLLQNGSPIFQSVGGNNETEYFACVSSDDRPTSSLVVLMTVYSGAPQLWARYSPAWSSAGAGGVGSGGIARTLQGEALGPSAQRIVIDNPQDGNYLIGIESLQPAIVMLSCDYLSPVSLPNAQPFVDSLEQPHARYYVIHSDAAPERSHLSIQLTPLLGQPQLEVALLDMALPLEAQAFIFNTLNPSHSYSHSRLRLTVPFNEQSTRRHADYLVRVTSDGAASRVIYTINAQYSKEGHYLVDGYPLHGYTETRTYSYFWLFVNNENTEQNKALFGTFSLHSGNVSLIISNQTLNPTINSPGSSVLQLTGNGMELPLSDFIGEFTVAIAIGVYAHAASRYSLTAARPHCVLAPGSPVHVLLVGARPPRVFLLAEVDRAHARDIIISLAIKTLQLPVVLQVIKQSLSEPLLPLASDGTLAQVPPSWTFTATTTSSFVIPTNDAQYCSTCRYYFLLSTVSVSSVTTQAVSLSIFQRSAIALLPLGHPYQTQISQSGVDYYEIPVPFNLPNSNQNSNQNSNYDEGFSCVVDLQLCRGNAELYVSSKSYSSQPYDYRVGGNSAGHFILPLQNITKDVYLSVRGVDAQSTYLLQIRPTNSGAFDRRMDKVLNVSLHSDNQVTVSWNPPLSARFSSADLVYFLFVDSVASDTSFSSACGLNLQKPVLKVVGKKESSTISATIKPLGPNQTFKLNILVQDPNGEQEVYVPVTVQTSAIKGDISSNTNLTLILGLSLGFGGGFILAAVIALVYIRHRDAKMKIPDRREYGKLDLAGESEMELGRNVEHPIHENEVTKEEPKQVVAFHVDISAPPSRPISRAESIESNDNDDVPVHLEDGTN